MKFIEQYIEEAKSDLANEGLLIFPTNRGIAEFRELYQQRMQQVAWLPEVQTLNGLIELFGTKKLATAVQKLMAIKKAAQDLNASSTSIALSNDVLTQLITDFEEVDRELIDSESLFKQVSYIKMMEKWKLGDEATGHSLQNQLKLWESLGDLYKNYFKELDKNGWATQAQLLRDLIADNAFLEYVKNYDYVHFIGFNNFNTTERKLLHFFNQNAEVKPFFDFDDFYLNNPQNIAGKFVKKQVENCPVSTFVLSADWKLKNQAVNYWNLNGNSEQISMLFDCLKSLPENTKTGVVFLDQNLLQYALNHLPKDLSETNIGVGIQLKHTPVFGLVQELVLSRDINSEELLKKYSFLRRDWLHRYTQNKSQNPDDFELLKIVSIELKKLETFLPKNSWGDFLKTALKVASNFIIEFDRQFTPESKANFSDFKSIFFNELGACSVSTVSSKNAHIQFLGILETRLLDFDKVILLSTNENNLPGQLGSKTLIPPDIRSAFNMTLPEDSEGLKAYYFYQSIQRATEVDIFVLAPNASFNSSEPSRYLKQLEVSHPSFIEIATKNSTGYSTLYSVPRVITLNNQIKVDIISYLTHKGLSPSALNLLIRNPYDFYLQYAVGLKEPDSTNEVVSHSELGSLFHVILENLYKPFCGQILSRDIMMQLQQESKGELQGQLEKLSKRLKLSEGQTSLYGNIVKVWVANFLEFDLNRIASGDEVIVEAVELEIETQLNIQLDHQPIKVKLKGIVDRVEQCNGKRMLIDYKTGKVETSDLKIKNFLQDIEKTKFSKALQLLFYSYIYSSKKSGEESSAGIYSCRNQTAGIIPLSIHDATAENPKDEFEGLLIKKIQDLFADDYTFCPSTEYDSKFSTLTV